MMSRLFPWFLAIISSFFFLLCALKAEGSALGHKAGDVHQTHGWCYTAEGIGKIAESLATPDMEESQSATFEAKFSDVCDVFYPAKRTIILVGFLFLRPYLPFLNQPEKKSWLEGWEARNDTGVTVYVLLESPGEDV